MNIVVLRGRLSSAPSTRTLPSGDRLVAYEVTVRPPERPAESVPVAWFDPPARAVDIEAGTEVVVTGRVRRRFFRAGGATASRTEVVADTVLPATRRAGVGRALADVAARIADAGPG